MRETLFTKQYDSKLVKNHHEIIIYIVLKRSP